MVMATLRAIPTPSIIPSVPRQRRRTLRTGYGRRWTALGRYPATAGGASTCSTAATARHLLLLLPVQNRLNRSTFVVYSTPEAVGALRAGGSTDAAGDRSDRRRAAALAFVEELALFLEREGLPRMAGRIFSWLLICDPPLQSAADLADALQASKGSISTMTALLARARLIERVALPGRRRDYYRVRPRAMSELMLEATARLAAFRRLAEQGLGLLDGAPPGVRERREDVLGGSRLLEAEHPALIVRFEARRTAPAGAPPGPPAGGRAGRD